MSDLKKINAKAQTFRYKSNSKTIWDNFHLLYNPAANSLDGYGTSIVGRKVYPFIVIGELLSTSGGKQTIRLTKHHPTINYPCIEYEGVFIGNKIHIVSHDSYGMIELNI